MMERQILHLTRLIDGLLDISRIDRGSLEFRRSSIDLRDVVAAAIEGCRPSIEGKKQRLTHLAIDSPLLLDGDAQRLSQVVWNLLTNASKYTPEGGAIEVLAYLNDSQAVVSVRDTGIGFDPSAADRLFGMFLRLGTDAGGAASGLGIGLAVARTLTEAHGGRIEAHSDGPGKGAVFTAYFPLRARMDAPAADKTAEG
jgi:signal transduction histidine kinase